MGGGWSHVEPVCWTCFRRIGQALADHYMGVKHDA
jgi:hypothetical protein